MARVILLCGKVCSGKSHYAEELRRRENGAVLSVDALMLTLFPEDLGDRHELYAARARKYLLERSLELLEAGVSVILDSGLWRREQRDELLAFYGSRGYASELHYLPVTRETQRANAALRNAAVAAGRDRAYLVDEGLLEKCDRLFEPPAAEELALCVCRGEE